MNIDIVFSGLNLNIVIEQKNARKMHDLWMMLVKIRGIKYFNIGLNVVCSYSISGYAPACKGGVRYRPPLNERENNKNSSLMKKIVYE